MADKIRSLASWLRPSRQGYATPTASSRSQSFTDRTDYDVGDRIGGLYEIVKIFGGEEAHGGVKSGMGIVYVTREAMSRRLVVLKTFQDRFLTSQQQRAMFREEAFAWTQVDTHPYVVRAEKVWEFGGRLYIMLEYVAPDRKGRNTLTHYLTGTPLSTDMILTWSIQFCYGMEHAVERGIACHRDIKPDNLMIAADRTLKITDFGLAGVLHFTDPTNAETDEQELSEPGRLTAIRVGKGTVCGTLGYIAPEVWSGAGADIRSDIFSFGVVLHQMISGRVRPYAVHARRGETFSDPPRLDSPLWSVVSRCLRAIPRERYQTFADLRADLGALLSQRGGRPVPTPTVADLSLSDIAYKGLALHHMGRREEALEWFTRALQVTPRSFGDWSDRGLVLDALERSEEAISCFDECLRLAPQSAVTWKNKGNVCDALGRDEEALKCYQEAVRLEPLYADAWSDLGVCLSRIGRYEEALEHYAHALALNPKLDSAWLNRSATLEDLNRLEDAVVAVERALELNPESKIAPRNKAVLLFRLGGELRQQDRHEDALRRYEQALKIEPENPAYASAKARALVSLHRFDQALVWCDQQLETHPKSPDLWHCKGLATVDTDAARAIECFDQALSIETFFSGLFDKARALTLLRRLPEALDCYDRALGLDPHDAAAWHNKGCVLGQLQSDEVALSCFDRALELNGTESAAWLGKATALLHLERLDEAMLCFERCVTIEPANEQLWYNIGNLLFLNDRSAEAERYLAEAITLNPRERLYQVLMAKIVMIRGRPSEGLDFSARAVELDPEYAEAWTTRGAALLDLERFEEAERCCMEALRIDPLDATAAFVAGSALRRLDRHAEAVEALDRSLAQNCSAWRVHYEKGQALASLRHFDDAVGAFDKALEADPSNAEVINEKGNALYRLGQLPSSLACYEQATNIAPDYAPAWFNRGMVSDEQGQSAEALSCYDRALTIDRTFLRAWDHKGRLLYSLGRSHEALHCFEQALEIDPQHTASWYAKAVIHDGLRRYSDALHSYERYLSLEPRQQDTFVEKARRRIEELATVRNDPGAAAGDADPQRLAQNYLGRAVDLVVRNQYTDALDLFDKALELNPSMIKAWNDKGALLARLNRHEEAVRCFDRATELME